MPRAVESKSTHDGHECLETKDTGEVIGRGVGAGIVGGDGLDLLGCQERGREGGTKGGRV